MLTVGNDDDKITTCLPKLDDGRKAKMTRDEMLALLSELIACHSPPGEETEIDAVIRREFEKTGAQVWQDDATNLVAHLPGEGPRVMVCAHKDEIGMVVAQVQDDGRLRVENCGGALAWKYGEGPVDVIADGGDIVRGILSVGSVHTRTGPLYELRSSRALTWDLVTIFTGLSRSELEAKGVHVGSRAVVARERKQVQRLGEYVASFALDDRMGLTALVAGLRAVALAAEGAGTNTQAGLYFVATHGEEAGMLGAVRAAHLLQPDVCIALDTSPVVPELPLAVDARPVIWYRERAYHNKAESDRLLRLANELGFGAQPCLYTAAGSDAGRVKQEGLAGRTVCFGFARDNSHGFEIAHIDSLVNVTRLLVRYLGQIGSKD
jgi:putative aminopeptidase FrvX